MWLTGIGSPVSGSGIRQDLGVLVMEIEDLGQRMGGAAQLGMVDDVGDALAVDPDLAGAAKAFQELLARACRHCFPSLSRRQDFQATGMVSASGGSFTTLAYQASSLGWPGRHGSLA